jgi:hypothetical protein
VKLQSEKRNLLTGGLQQTQQFQIQASGKAFRILSDGLYSDKPLAIVRELSCNAWDSHVEAGVTDVSFELHLPNTLEPYFEVKDYGLGLAHNDVMNLYTTYFDSTKTDSNLMIGALGLGSKSPFSYVDQFTVESRFNGTKSLYSAYISNDDIPCISLVDQRDTEEHNGISIRLPIKQGDFPIFEQKIKYFFKRWTNKPKIIGSRHFEWEEFEYVLQGTDWKVRSNKEGKTSWRHSIGSHSLKECYAIQGNVSYKIENIDFLSGDETCLFQLPLDVYFNIGELDVQASREGLSYKTITKDNLKKKFQRIYKEIQEEVSKEIKLCKTLYEAKTKFIELKYTSEIFKVLKFDKILWQGREITEEYIIPEDMRDKFKLFYLDRSDCERRKTWKYYTGNALHITWKPVHNSQYYHTGGSYKTILWLDDLSKGGSDRLKYHIKEVINSDIEQWYLFRPEDTEDYEGSFKKLWKVWENPECGYKRTSDLPEVPKEERIKSELQKIYLYKGLKNTSRSRWSYQETYALDWVAAERELTDGGVFVHLNNYKPLKDGKKYTDIDAFNRIVKYAKELGITSEIYGIPATHKKKIDANLHHGWKEFFSLTEDKLRGIIKERDKEIKATLIQQSWELEISSILSQVCSIIRLSKYMPKDTNGSLSNLYNLWKLMTLTDTKDTSKWIKLYKLVLDPQDYLCLYDDKELKEWSRKVLLEDLPMLQYVDGTIDEKNLIDYLKLKEN